MTQKERKKRPQKKAPRAAKPLAAPRANTGFKPRELSLAGAMHTGALTGIERPLENALHGLHGQRTLKLEQDLCQPLVSP